MSADLSLQQSPPFSVPARFLVSAPFFSLLASLILLWHGPEIFSQRWSPEILAVTHFLTLGFLSMSMLGAMMQLIPVLMGSIIPHAVLFSRLVHTTLFSGSLCLGLAWLLQINLLFNVAVFLLGFSFFIFIAVMIERLWHSANRHATRSMMMLALLCLFITVAIGLYLTLGHGIESIPLARQLTNLHLSWGLLGWVLLLIIAVAYQVVPMFQITDDYPARHQRWMGRIIFFAVAGLSLKYIWPTSSSAEILSTVSTTILAGCLLVFALTTLWILHKRRRRLPDTTLNFWRLAMFSLLLLVLLWLTSTLSGIKLPPLLLAILMIHGFAMTTVNGMIYKIIPFTIWLHLSTHNKNLRDIGKRQEQVSVPHMRQIIPNKASLWQFRFHLSSVLLLVLATMWPSWFYYSAVSLFALAQALLLFNLLKAVYFYNMKMTELSSTSKRFTQ
jgi:hypothetical protein